MKEKTLSIAFGDSLKEESIACISDLAEVSLDAIMDDGILKEVPILSTAVAVYKIGSSIKERHNLKKLLVFLNELNNGITDEQKRKEYQEKFQSNEKFRNQEIEYLLVLIDRYISYDKPKMLAKLYLAYLDRTISWEEFIIYAEIIDSFLPGDQNYLLRDFPIVTHNNKTDSGIIRLVSLGLIIQTNTESPIAEDGHGGFSVTSLSMTKAKLKEKVYGRTEFGKTLADIFNRT